MASRCVSAISDLNPEIAAQGVAIHIFIQLGSIYACNITIYLLDIYY